MKGTGRKESVQDVSVGEWIVAAISTLIVLAMIGFLVRNVVADGKGLPDVQVHAVGEVLQATNGFIVEFEARNTGETTAAAVDVEGVLFDGAEEVDDVARVASQGVEGPPLELRFGLAGKQRAQVVGDGEPRVGHQPPGQPGADVADRIRHRSREERDQVMRGREDQAIVEPVQRPAARDGLTAAGARGRRQRSAPAASVSSSCRARGSRARRG